MYTVEHIEAPLSDETACDINAFENGLLLEMDPQRAPLPVSFTKAYAQQHDPTEVTNACIARSVDNSAVGAAWMFASLVDSPHLCYARLGVAAQHRERGVATKLLEAYVAFAAEHGRTSLLLGADLHHPSADRFAASLGASVALRAHINRLLLTDLPEGLVEHWIASAHAATGAVHEYELVWVPDNEYPEEWLADLCVVSDVLMNDAPMDGIPLGERHTTPEQLRAHAARATAFAHEWWTLVARHRATGAPVGYTEMVFHPEDPEIGWQGATAVGSAHRGHALGRWLKAAMLQRLLQDKPHITSIRTFNADSNDPMLAINFAMGFKNLYPACRWLVERSDTEAWLEKRT